MSCLSVFLGVVFHLGGNLGYLVPVSCLCCPYQALTHTHQLLVFHLPDYLGVCLVGSGTGDVCLIKVIALLVELSKLTVAAMVVGFPTNWY